jgi:putative aldouronate transport system permease protein
MRLSGSTKSNAALLLMCLPGLLVLFVFTYLPMAGLILAFKHYVPNQGVFGSAWAGFTNFDYLFQTNVARTITFNTLFMNALFMVSTTVGAIFVAMLLNEIRVRSGVLADLYQSILFFPFFLSYVIISYVAFGFLNADGGVLNQLLGGIGVSGVDWYHSPSWWPAILTGVNFWQSVGFFAILYLAGILAINPEYYEAAAADGAGKLRQAFTITLPLLSPLIVVNVLLMVGRIFYADFGLFYNVPLNQPALYPTTDVVDTYVFRALTVTGDVGLAAAAGLYQAFCGFVLVLGANAAIRRIAPEKALF